MDDIKLALLGSKEAAKRLTEKGVLVPCPHCGAEAKMLRMGGIKRFFFNPTVKRPTCTKCRATMFVWFSEYQARLAWNTRAPILSAEEMEMLEGANNGIVPCDNA